MNTLGSEVRRLLVEVTNLIVATRSKAKRETLLQRQADLAGQLQDLVDKQVDEALPEYEEATKALAKATKAAKAAKDDLDKVVEAIEKVAAAVDALGKLTVLL